MYLKQLKERRAKALAKIMELRSKMDAESRDLNDGEQTEWDTVNAEYDSVNEQIARLERADALDAESRNHNQIPGREDRDGSQTIDAVRASILAVNAFARSLIGRDLTDEQRTAVQQLGFRMGGQTIEVPMHRTAPRTMAEARAMSAVIGADGGFTVPTGFVQNIEVARLRFAVLREHAEVMRTPAGNDLPWPTSNDTANEGSWVGESEDQSSGTDVTFGQTIFRGHKVSSKVILIPFELIEDSAFDILSFVAAAGGERIGRAEAGAFTTGDGVKKPTGIVTSATAGKTTASATAITFDEILDLEHSVDPAYRAEAKYMMHDNILGALRKLKDTAGAYIWQAGVAGSPDKINNHPLVINQKMASSVVANAKTIVFGDLSKYKIRDVGSMRVKFLTERYAELDQVGVLVIGRVDGHLLDAGTNPVKYLLQHA